MKGRLIIPLDGSEAAEAALVYAEVFPSDDVLLLICLPNQNDLPSLLDPASNEALHARIRENAETYLERMAGAFQRQGRSAQRLVLLGDPSQQIVSIATPNDMIVMTTHGRGAGRLAIFGSVADRVVRHAAAPVFVVRGGARPNTAASIARVVVALDGSELAEQALPIASELAADLRVPIHLVRVLNVRSLKEAQRAETYTAATYAGSIEEIREALTKYLSELAEALSAQGHSVSASVLDGSPAEKLIEFAQQGDVIAITTHGRGGFVRWMLGSVADKLVRLAPVPMLVCRAQ